MEVSKEAPQNQRAGDDVRDDGEGMVAVVRDVEDESILRRKSLKGQIDKFGQGTLTRTGSDRVRGRAGPDLSAGGVRD